jgi:hypothetical protein
MKQNFIRLIFIAALFTLSSGASAQSVSKTLKLAAKAAGGEKALSAAMKSFQKTGEITRLSDGERGKFSIQGAAPNFYNVSYDLGGFEIEAGFNGKSAWTRDSRGGLQTLTGAASRYFQAEAMFRNNLWLDYKKEKAKISSCQSANVADGKTADCLLFTTAKGVSIKLFFDRASGLLVREEIPAGTGAVKIFDYADFRKINGVSEPFSIKMTEGEDVYEVKLERITHGAQIAAADFDFPKTSGEPLPDISALLKAVRENEERIEKILEDYHYKQKVVSRKPDKNGVLRETGSQVVQLSFYKGNRLRRLVEKNGKPLSASEQADEDKKVQKRVEEIEKQIAKKEAKTALQPQSKADDDDDQRTSIAEFLRASNLINPRRETFRGREVIVFDFEPNPNFDYKNAKGILRLFGKMAGAMWIDIEDKQVARLEAVLADNYKVGGLLMAKLKKGAYFITEKERVGNEIWLPSTAELNMSVKALLVAGFSANQLAKYYDYGKFSTEVKDSKVDEIK